MALYKSGYDLI